MRYNTQILHWKTVPVESCILLVEVYLEEWKNSQDIDLHVYVTDQHAQSYDNFDRRTFRVTFAVAKQEPKAEFLAYLPQGWWSLLRKGDNLRK